MRTPAWRAARSTPMPIAKVEAKIAVTPVCCWKISIAAALPAARSRPPASMRPLPMPARVPAARRPPRGRARDIGVERVRQIGQEEAERPGPRHAEPARHHVRLVAEGSRGVENAVAGSRGRTCLGMFVEDPRHQAHIDPGERGNVTYGASPAFGSGWRQCDRSGSAGDWSDLYFIT